MASTDTVNNPADGHWYPPPAISDADLTTKIKKKNKKHSKKVPPSSAVQTCPLTNAPAPKEDPKKKTCTFSGLKVSKPDRKFDLIVDASTPSIKRTIAIVAGFKNKPAKVTYELQGPVGPCPEIHNNKRSINTGSGSFKKISSTENKLELEVTSSTKIQLFPWGFTPDKYTISANRCGHMGESATLEVYPDTETDVYIGFDFKETKFKTDAQKEVEQADASKKKEAKLQEKGLVRQKTTSSKEESTEITKGLRVGGSVKYDGNEHKVEFVFKKTIDTLKKFKDIVDYAKVSMEKLKGNKAGASTTGAFSSQVELGIKAPVIELHVGGAWKEDEGKPTVNYEGKIKLEGSPLFGLSFQWNITETVLKFIPGGEVFTRIKKKFEGGFLDLLLKANGDFTGGVELTIRNKEITNVTGKLGVKIPIVAELVVLKYEVDILIIHATIEIKVAVESGFEVEAKYESSSKVFDILGGMLDFVIWWSESSSGGVVKKSTNPDRYNTSTKNEGGLSQEGKHILYKKTFEGKHKFFTHDFKKP